MKDKIGQKSREDRYKTEPFPAESRKPGNFVQAVRQAGARSHVFRLKTPGTTASGVFARSEGPGDMGCFGAFGGKGEPFGSRFGRRFSNN